MAQGCAAQDDIVDEDDVATFDVFDDLIVRSANHRWTFARIKITQSNRCSTPNDRVDGRGSVRRCDRTSNSRHEVIGPIGAGRDADDDRIGFDQESAARHPGMDLVDDAGSCRAVVAVLRRLDETAERRPLVAIGTPDRAEHVDVWRLGHPALQTLDSENALPRLHSSLVLTIVRISARTGVHLPLTGDPP